MKSQSVLVKFMDSGSESRQGSWGFLTFRTRNKEAQNQQMTVQVGEQHHQELFIAPKASAEGACILAEMCYY